MNDHEKSHTVVVPAKPRNKEAEAQAEATADGVEGRTVPKGNLEQRSTFRTLCREGVELLDQVLRVPAVPSTSTPTPKGGTGCGNSARPGLCGGHPATGVPTAILPIYE